MITSHGITNAAGFYESNMQAQKTGGIAEKNIIKAEETTVKSSEDKLSAKAQKYLESLRETYGDYDFIIADDGDDRQALLKQSNKEFSVIFSSAELERMASDEKYAQEKLHAVKTIVEMTDRINQQFGYERAWGKNGTGIINKIAVSINDDFRLSVKRLAPVVGGEFVDFGFLCHFWFILSFCFNCRYYTTYGTCCQWGKSGNFRFYAIDAVTKTVLYRKTLHLVPVLVENLELFHNIHKFYHYKDMVQFLRNILYQ